MAVYAHPQTISGPKSSACFSAKRSFVPGRLRVEGVRRSSSTLKRSSHIISPTLMSVAQETSAAVNKETIDELAAAAQVWAAQNGLLMGVGGDAPPSHLVHAPVTLLPSPLPKAAYQQALDLAEICNSLVDGIASDEDYLRSTLKEVCAGDEFTNRLMQIFEQTRAEAARSNYALGVLRSDYMLDQPSGGMLQVELNTIASSFGCLSTQVARMHKHLVDRANLQGKYAPESLPENLAMEGISEGLAAAVKVPPGGEDGAMLMVVQPGERNAFDQHWLESKLWEKHRVRTIRKSLAEVAAQGVLGPDGSLYVEKKRVTLVYFRAGYTPNDYPSETEWEGRLLLEKSDTVKCPNIAYHLTGTKKVQQDLARPGVLERFLSDPVEVAAMRKCFAGLWGLAIGVDEGVEEAVAMALADPEGFVLKPQREGGGNNLYGVEMCGRLQSLKGLEAYILMQRIVPPEQTAVMMRDGKVTTVPTLSELGIYSTFLRKDKNVLISRSCGHLLRTKASNSNEGGVAAGFSVLDSPWLV